MFLRPAAFLLCAAAACAQSLSIGVKGGVPLLNNFDAGPGGYTHTFVEYWSQTRRYTVGPAIGIRLAHGFALEIDALYRRLNYDSFTLFIDSAQTGGAYYSWEAHTGNRIDLPVLLRWSFARRLVIAGGPAFSIHYGLTSGSHTIAELPLGRHTDTFRILQEQAPRRVARGLTFGVGFDAGSRLQFIPEFRYTRWISPAFLNPGYFGSVRNDPVLLLGFSFDLRLPRKH